LLGQEKNLPRVESIFRRVNEAGVGEEETTLFEVKDSGVRVHTIVKLIKKSGVTGNGSHVKSVPITLQGENKFIVSSVKARTFILQIKI
jgi:hypothetical protein